MKILILEGSPRKGNTKTAVTILEKGIKENITEAETETIHVCDLDIAPCSGCDGCADTGRCVFDDGGSEIVDKVKQADVLVFATPVYWWGITAQLKIVIDRFYSGSLKTTEGPAKKMGLIVVGEGKQTNPQYRFIEGQFGCIAEYLGWEYVFAESYTALAPDDLAKDRIAVEDIGRLWRKII